MNQLIALAALFLVAAAPEAQPESWTLRGQVASVSSEGIFVVCRGEATSTLKAPAKGEIVFVRGKFSFAQGDAINLSAEPIGTHPSESGESGKTVRAFEIRN